MKKICFALSVIMVTIAITASAQYTVTPKGANKLTVVSGDLKFLKGVTALNVEFSFDDMKVGDMSESDYIIKHSAEMEKSKAGSSEDWKKHWVEDRSNRFIPEFLNMFSKRLKKVKIAASPNNSTAKYSVIIKTECTEPGFYAVGVEKKAYIDVRVIFYETGNPSNELCEIIGTHIQSADKNTSINGVAIGKFDTGTRIKDAYFAWGNMLGAYIAKTVKKLNK